MKIKHLISLLFAVTAVVLTMALNVSAAVSTDWDSYTSTGVNADITLTVNHGSTGTVQVKDGATLTVTGTTIGNLEVELEENTHVVWQANVNAPGSVTINIVDYTFGTGTTATFNGATINTNGSPAVTIGAGVGSVTVSNSTIRTVSGKAIQTASNLTLNSGTITGNGSYGTAVAITGDTELTISGATLEGDNYGVYTADSQTTITMTSGSVSAEQAINAAFAEKVEISGGTLSGVGYGTTCIYTGAVTTIISGGDITGGWNGVLVTGGTLEMTGGTITAEKALNLNSFTAASIIGGTIKSNGGGDDAAVYIIGNGTTTIGGTAVIDGNTAHGVCVSNGSAVLLITNGTISGDDNAVQLNSFGSATITGGTFSGMDNSFGQGIRSGITKKFKIKPTASTPVIVKGFGQALFQTDAPTPDIENVLYYFTSENFNGTGKTAYRNSENPFVNDTSYKYIELWANAPSFNVKIDGGTANGMNSQVTVPADTTVKIVPARGKEFTIWRADGVTLSSPYIGSQSFVMPLNDVTLTANFRTPTPMVYQPIPYVPAPETPAPSVEPVPEWIEVIATLNKSGTVNSKETAADVAEAQGKNSEKILLIIPRDGTGISRSAVQKIYKAADETPIYLTFDFYETAEDEKSDGNLLVKLTDKTGQILTRAYFDGAENANAQSYIMKNWKLKILGSVLTAQKSGWGDKAQIAVNLNELGLTSIDNENLYALIFDINTGKWYQIKAKIIEDDIVVNTTRSGVITFVQGSVK
jgi:hypothetical protein